MSETTQKLLDEVNGLFEAAQKEAKPGKRVFVRPFAEKLGADLDEVKKDQARRRMERKRMESVTSDDGADVDSADSAAGDGAGLMVSDGGRTRCFGLDRIVVWDNARNFFDKDELNGLGISIWKTGGTIQDPFGYVKRVGDLTREADGSEWERLLKGVDPDDEVCVLLGGERRFRAMRLLADGLVKDAATGELIVLDEGELEGFARLWMKVIDEPSRKQKFVLNLTENTQRSELRFSELADRFTTMLEEVNPVSGAKVWTQESIADEMGYSPGHVGRVVIAARSPERVRKALDGGQISLYTGALLGGLPDDAAERAADDVAFGSAGPLPEKAAAGLIARKYRRELRTAIFKIDDSAGRGEFAVGLEEGFPEWLGRRLDGAAGDDFSCRGCVEFSGNRDDVGGKTTCLNPGCFVRKQGLAIEGFVGGSMEWPEKWSWERAMLQGAREVVVWDGDEAERNDVFEGDWHSQRVSPFSEFVDLAESPPGKLLAAEHRASSAVPKWGRILEDSGLPVTVCFDLKGRLRLLAGLDNAVGAAALSPFSSLFPEGAGSGLVTDDQKAANNRVKCAVDSERRSVEVDGSAEFLKCMGGSGSSAVVDADGAALWRLVIRGVWDQVALGDDLVFLCEVVDGFGARHGDSLERLVTWLAEGSRSAGEVLGMLMLSIQVRDVRLNGFAAWTEVDENDFNPWARVCELVGFDPLEWDKRLARRVSSVERTARAAEEAKLEVKENEDTGAE
jgi:ParB-like chromosome segregation protein Spo0J